MEYVSLLHRVKVEVKLFIFYATEEGYPDLDEMDRWDPILGCDMVTALTKIQKIVPEGAL